MTPQQTIDLPARARITLVYDKRLGTWFNATWTKPTTFQFIMDGAIVDLTVSQRKNIWQAARHAGERIASEPDAPVDVLFVLAAMALLEEEPDQDVLMVAARFGQGDLNYQSDPRTVRLRDSEVRELVQSAISRRVNLEVPSNGWNIARALIMFGQELWKLKGDDARFYGGIDWTQDIAKFHVLMNGAGIVACTRKLQQSLPVPVSDRREALPDWLALAQGPEPIPPEIIPDGLGCDYKDNPLVKENTDRGFDLPYEQGMILHTMSKTLLETADRPFPRYIGRMLEIAIDYRLIGQLAPWGIAAFRVIPHRRGLWIAAVDREGRHAAVSWWSALSSSATVAPLTFPSALWVLVHAFACALWHDLCADSVEIAPPPGAETYGVPQKTSRKHPKHRQKSIVLPPARYARASWGSEEERELLAHYRSIDPGYRALPEGWEQRQHKPDFQRRQERAAKRAEDAGMEPPPPGYTFVKGTYRPSTQIATAETRKTNVRSRGLFNLALTLDHRVQRATPEEE